MQVIIGVHANDTFWEPFVEIDFLRDPRPLQKFTEDQLEALPQQFRCFCCGDMTKRKDIGGIEMRQRLCKLCWPWLDEWATGCLVWWSLKHGFQVKDY